MKQEAKEAEAERKAELKEAGAKRKKEAQEAEARRKKEAKLQAQVAEAQLKKEEKEAEAKRKKEAQEAEAKCKKEAQLQAQVAEAQRKKVEEKAKKNRQLQLRALQLQATVNKAQVDQQLMQDTQNAAIQVKKRKVEVDEELEKEVQKQKLAVDAEAQADGDSEVSIVASPAHLDPHPLLARLSQYPLTMMRASFSWCDLLMLNMTCGRFVLADDEQTPLAGARKGSIAPRDSRGQGQGTSGERNSGVAGAGERRTPTCTVAGQGNIESSGHSKRPCHGSAQKREGRESNAGGSRTTN